MGVADARHVAVLDRSQRRRHFWTDLFNNKKKSKKLKLTKKKNAQNGSGAYTFQNGGCKHKILIPIDARRDENRKAHSVQVLLWGSAP